MKNITLMGIEYNMDMVNTLRKYNDHMTEIVAKMNTRIDSDIALMDVLLEMENEKEKYINSLNENEQFTIKHFIDASVVKERHPILASLPCIPFIAITCVIPSMSVRLLISALLAAILTLNLKILSDKKAYNNIMNLVLSKSN